MKKMIFVFSGIWFNIQLWPRYAGSTSKQYGTRRARGNAPTVHVSRENRGKRLYIETSLFVLTLLLCSLGPGSPDNALFSLKMTLYNEMNLFVSWWLFSLCVITNLQCRGWGIGWGLQSHPTRLANYLKVMQFFARNWVFTLILTSHPLCLHPHFQKSA